MIAMAFICAAILLAAIFVYPATSSTQQSSVLRSDETPVFSCDRFSPDPTEPNGYQFFAVDEYEINAGQSSDHILIYCDDEYFSNIYNTLVSSDQPTRPKSWVSWFDPPLTIHYIKRVEGEEPTHGTLNDVYFVQLFGPE